MKLSKAQKNEIIKLFKAVDVKKLEIEVENEERKKFFRFGSFYGLQVASEIIKAIDESPARKTPVAKS